MAKLLKSHTVAPICNVITSIHVLLALQSPTSKLANFDFVGTQYKSDDHTKPMSIITSLKYDICDINSISLLSLRLPKTSVITASLSTSILSTSQKCKRETIPMSLDDRRRRV